MSLCGATENLVELTQSIGSTDELVGTLFDKIPISPTVSQAVTDAAAIIDMATDAQAIQELVTSKLKQYVPEIEVPEEIKGLQADIESFASSFLAAKLSVDDITNEINNLQTKYSGLDLGDIAIEDIPDLLKTGALDLNNLCQKIPNFEEDGAGFVLKGAPISTPTDSPIANILGINIPNIFDFPYRIDAVKKSANASGNFVNVNIPPDSIGM